MRKVILMLAVVLLTLSVGCTKEREVIVVVPNVEVHLSTKSVFNVEQEGFSTRSTTEYQHVYPTEFKAYFIANETKGQYTEGQLVTTIDVKEGMQTVTVPKLSYKVYVTNFEDTRDKWYTWSDALEQMPLTSDVLFLFGSSVIDYGTQLAGEVLVKNPYSAVMIQDTRIPNAPIYYGNSTSYISTGEGWWLKYIRNNTTNTGVVVESTHENKTITINDPIEANKIYKYTLSADVPEDDKNFFVDVEDFGETVDREIEVW